MSQVRLVFGYSFTGYLRRSVRSFALVDAVDVTSKALHRVMVLSMWRSPSGCINVFSLDYVEDGPFLSIPAIYS